MVLIMCEFFVPKSSRILVVINMALRGRWGEGMLLLDINKHWYSINMVHVPMHSITQIKI